MKSTRIETMEVKSMTPSDEGRDIICGSFYGQWPSKEIGIYLLSKRSKIISKIVTRSRIIVSSSHMKRRNCS
ncbi:hypothetical protein EUGRSUZ_D00558 [Eucalyptus grandis]|uniref:Uncharacterized protein n=2 Tax=Eucalyptus grandis TaxID=71139 RepID=A0A059CCR6_EUCGR|nr:hypothetical protein EUGRSUZ_D00558 [Eucalyptus grandis]